ncbi:MAG: shikimate kinase [Chlorobi bacterium]|nr:shikimate kinase [Chlorobiota bacterium]
MSKIYVVGFMGVGKSTVGKKLARKLGYDFLDMDDAFEEKYKISIQDFFEKYGEELFRKLEHQLLKDTFTMENVVISTGGGTVVCENAMELMNKNGITIYLKMPVGALVKRLKNVKRKRPLIHGKKENEIEQVIEERMKERFPYYQTAKIEVDVTGIDVQELVRKIKAQVEVME